MTQRIISFDVPAWLDDAVATWPHPLTTEDEQMALCIALSDLNVSNGGGPFGAAVFSGERVIAVGVNRVLGSGLSIAHAEIVAIMRAQLAYPAMLGDQRAPTRLVTSAEPCCQCFGALVWSGIDELVCGANTSDVEAVGFDEGPKPHDWVDALVRRGIGVKEGVGRSAASAVLQRYARDGGAIYGLRHPRIPG